MKTRIVFGVLLFPLVILLIVLGGSVLRGALFAVSVIALYELDRSLFKTKTRFVYWGFLALALYYWFLPYSLVYFFPFLLLWMLFNMVAMVFTYPRITPSLVFASAVLPIYSGVFLSTIYLIREINAYWVWLIFAGAWGSDIFAYFVGKAMGKHKLVPLLSPSKTREGAIGGVLGGAIVGVTYWYVLTLLGIYAQHPVTFAVICMVLAVFSQLGDLCASAIKRHMSIKDFGKLIPGHGGIMDRFDSVLIVAPILYVFLLFYL